MNSTNHHHSDPVCDIGIHLWLPANPALFLFPPVKLKSTLAAAADAGEDCVVLCPCPPKEGMPFITVGNPLRGDVGFSCETMSKRGWAQSEISRSGTAANERFKTGCLLRSAFVAVAG